MDGEFDHVSGRAASAELPLLNMRALSLRERALLFGRPSAATGAGPEGAARVRWWRKRYFGGSSGRFGRWIAVGGLRNAGQLACVSEISGAIGPDEGLDEASADWRRWLAEVHADLERSNAHAVASSTDVFCTVRPFLEWAGRAFRSEISRRYDLSPAERDVVSRAFGAWISRRLVEIATPSSAVVLNIATLTGQLAGGTPSERLSDFGARMMRSGERGALLQQTPVLDRCLAEAAGRTLAACLETVGHFAADRASLRTEFHIDGALTGLRFGLGDAHRGGRTVALFEFGEKKLIYKPRSMKTDVVFGQLLGWMGSHLPDGPRPLQALEMGDHGWSEVAHSFECGDPEEVAAGYRRVGMLLAAFKLCGGTDLHFENLVFSGSQPFVVDLETLLTPVMHMRRRDQLAFARASAASILHPGFLPGGAMIGNMKRDISAAGLDEAVVAPFQSRIMDRSVEDRPVMQEGEYKIEPSSNVIRLDGEIQSPARHVDQIIDGYRAAWRLFLRQRRSLKAPHGLLEGFRTAEVRWVAKGTAQYSVALIDSHHPAHMRDGLDHEMAFAALFPPRLAFRGAAEVTRSEVAALWRRDIPLFRVRADSRDVIGCDGRIIPGVFARSGFEDLRRRLQTMTPEGLERDLKAIRIAFEAVKSPGEGHPGRGRAPRARRPETLRHPLEAAQAIAHVILADAAMQDGLPFWVTARNMTAQSSAAHVTAYDLYSGMSGIGVFVAELHQRTGDARLRELAEACRRGVVRALRSGTQGLGAYNGDAGLIYAELCISRSLGFEPHPCLGPALERLVAPARKDRIHDIIGGNAGLTLVALRAAEAGVHADLCRSLARAAADRLLASALPDEDGSLCWPHPLNKPPLTGFAHGACGNAVALALAGRRLSEPAFTQAAAGAMRFADRIYDRQAGLWRDVTGGGSGRKPTPSMGWCHGTPGIVLARQLIEPLLDGAPAPHRIRELERGLTVVATHLTGGNDSLCHGVFGNIEPLLRAGSAHRTAAEDAVARATARGGSTGYTCAVGGSSNPGLMLGLSGIGLQLIRLAGRGVANPLTLELPGDPG